MQDKKVILVIDDEPEIRDLLKDFLEDNDLSVVLINDGVEALEYMEKKVPDLVITDLLLPGEHGIDLVKIIKEKYFIPVIVMSGIYRYKEVSQVMEEDYVEAFFEKPLALERLLEVIDSLING
ncbi:MAG: response regulator [Candidatus Aminicenantes bacterium]|nr:response regulator [Candidatus Aminicenantes bacterium]